MLEDLEASAEKILFLGDEDESFGVLSKFDENSAFYFLDLEDSELVVWSYLEGSLAPV